MHGDGIATIDYCDVTSLYVYNCYYCVLFRKLVSRKCTVLYCSPLVELVAHSRHFARIQWAGVLSDNFAV